MKTIKKVKDGDIRTIRDGSFVTVENMTGGVVWTWDNSTLTVENMTGGVVRAWDDSSLTLKLNL